MSSGRGRARFGLFTGSRSEETGADAPYVSSTRGTMMLSQTEDCRLDWVALRCRMGRRVVMSGGCAVCCGHVMRKRHVFWVTFPADKASQRPLR